MLNELIAKIKQEVSDTEENSSNKLIIDQFNRTLEYVKDIIY